MKTLPHAWKSFSAFIRWVTSLPQSRELGARAKEVVERANHHGQRLVQATQSAMQRFAHAARGVLIQRCLEFANYLERIEANAITRAATEKFGSERPLLPAPTFPNPRRLGKSWSSPPPRVSLLRSFERRVIPISYREPISAMSELREEDFDDAPTAIYHPIPEQPDNSPWSRY